VHFAIVPSQKDVIARLDRGNPVLTSGVYWIARSSRVMTTNRVSTE